MTYRIHRWVYDPRTEDEHDLGAVGQEYGDYWAAKKAADALRETHYRKDYLEVREIKNTI